MVISWSAVLMILSCMCDIMLLAMMNRQRDQINTCVTYLNACLDSQADWADRSWRCETTLATQAQAARLYSTDTTAWTSVTHNDTANIDMHV
jgi:hypothetical protein